LYWGEREGALDVKNMVSIPRTKIFQRNTKNSSCGVRSLKIDSLISVMHFWRRLGGRGRQKLRGVV